MRPQLLQYRLERKHLDEAVVVRAPRVQLEAGWGGRTFKTEVTLIFRTL